MDGDRLWPATYYRAIGFTSYATTVGEVNDHGDFGFRYDFVGLYSGRYCSLDGESEVTTPGRGATVVPWRCEPTGYSGGTYAGGKAFHGINNVGDAVGVFTPGVYSYQSSYPNNPWVWLRGASGERVEYDANDLLPRVANTRC